MIVDDFNPGDHTRYIMCLVRYRDPQYNGQEHWLFSSPNHGVSFAYPTGKGMSPLDITWVQRHTGGINPWTARAFLLFAMMHTDIEVDLTGCPEP
jgi:hypothetical protein